MLNGTREQFQSSEVVVKAEVILHCSSCMFHFCSMCMFYKIASKDFLHFGKRKHFQKDFPKC